MTFYETIRIESQFTKYYNDEAAKSWLATARDGTKYYYGQSAASRQDDPNDSNRVFKWCLDRVEDTNGNYMTLSYTKDRGQIYLDRIDYTGNQSGSLSPTNAVIFHLEDGQPAQTKLYTTNFEVVIAKLLKTIEIQSNDGLSRAYN